MRLFLCLILVLSSLVFNTALADEEDYLITPQESDAILADQIKKLQAQPRTSCPAEFGSLFASKSLNIAIFYGYENFGRTAADRLNAAAQVRALTRPCNSHLEICGFRKTATNDMMTRLEKVVKGQNVTITVVTSSLTEDNNLNMDPNGLLHAQEERSHYVKSLFEKSLSTYDVVLYSGHSREGGGPGFQSPFLVAMGFNYLFRGPMKDMLDAVAKKPSRLKLLGLYACQAVKYYQEGLEKANPNLSLLLTTEDADDAEAEQMLLGTLNSILSRRCAREFRDSVVGASYPDHRIMSYINKMK